MDVEHQPASHGDGGEHSGRGSGVGLRPRLLGAILVVALATIVVGAVGINRMSALSAKAEQVYTDGAQPLDGLRRLQSDWWQLSAHTARANITGLPATTIAEAQKGAAAAGKALTADGEAVAKMPLAPEARQAFEQFEGAVKTYLTALTQLQGLGLGGNPATIGGLLKT